MSAKHRLTYTLQRTDEKPRSGLAFGVGSILCAAGLAGLLANAHEADNTTEAAVTMPAPSQARPVSQEGTLIAVSAHSMTARSDDGYTQTYLLTPDTAVIAGGGGHPVSAAAHFTVNDEVAIVGTVQNGRVTATAVAERHSAHGDGPPMDFGL